MRKGYREIWTGAFLGRARAPRADSPGARVVEVGEGSRQRGSLLREETGAAARTRGRYFGIWRRAKVCEESGEVVGLRRRVGGAKQNPAVPSVLCGWQTKSDQACSRRWARAALPRKGESRSGGEIESEGKVAAESSGRWTTTAPSEP